MKCHRCNRDFPEALLAPSGIHTCPICMLVLRNRQHGIPDGTPFNGTQAQMFFSQAMDHLKKTMQKIETYEVVKEELRIPEGTTVTIGGRFFVNKNLG